MNGNVCLMTQQFWPNRRVAPSVNVEHSKSVGKLCDRIPAALRSSRRRLHCAWRLGALPRWWSFERRSSRHLAPHARTRPEGVAVRFPNHARAPGLPDLVFRADVDNHGFAFPSPASDFPRARGRARQQQRRHRPERRQWKLHIIHRSIHRARRVVAPPVPERWFVPHVHPHERGVESG